MIDFNCPNCHAAFSVPDNLAGRWARCKICSGRLQIPEAEQRLVLDESPPPGPRLSPRQRRLKADAEQMRAAFGHFPLIKVRAMIGDPIETYELEYFIRGLERVPGRREPIERNYHCVEIKLGYEYPRLGPKCRMLTPVFHPNIEPATICVGDHWTAGERLVDLCVRIGEMITFQAYNIKSPLDAEAAMWADLHARELPVDDRNLRPPELD
jgi:ubiquitin-protein ligase